MPDKVLYCDTDSLFTTGTIDKCGPELGQWKFEGKASKLYLCGKKLYAAELENGEQKMATKGAALEFADVIKISQGQIIHWENTITS